jgi:6-phosphogluconolactonase
MDTIAGREIEIIVADSAEEVAELVADRLVETARGGGSIVATGGSGPRRAYQLAAEREPDWGRAQIWWGDERCVPPDDERSNYRNVKEELLDRLQGQPAAVHRMRGELGKDKGAEDYERELDSSVLDLVLLGMGPDGHIASLYPNQPTLEVTDRRVVGAEAHLDPYVDRISLTLPALRAGRGVLFLVTGEAKADAAARAFTGAQDPGTPASLLRASSGNTVAVLDRAAAARL